MKIQQKRRKYSQPRSKRMKSRDTWYRYLRHQARHLKVGRVIETCGCDVARITHIDPDTDDLTYVSLTSGHTGSCSIYNCGPIRLNPVAIERRLQLFKEGGKKALTLRYWREDCGMTPEQIEKQEKEWG